MSGQLHHATISVNGTGKNDISRPESFKYRSRKDKRSGRPAQFRSHSPKAPICHATYSVKTSPAAYRLVVNHFVTGTPQALTHSSTRQLTEASSMRVPLWTRPTLDMTSSAVVVVPTPGKT